jgi:hypothetical protein
MQSQVGVHDGVPGEESCSRRFGTRWSVQANKGQTQAPLGFVSV